MKWLFLDLPDGAVNFAQEPDDFMLTIQIKARTAVCSHSHTDGENALIFQAENIFICLIISDKKSFQAICLMHQESEGNALVRSITRNQVFDEFAADSPGTRNQLLDYTKDQGMGRSTISSMAIVDG
jgi:hypothetical protein